MVLTVRRLKLKVSELFSVLLILIPNNDNSLKVLSNNTGIKSVRVHPYTRLDLS
jgi:hypothetical protein